MFSVNEFLNNSIVNHAIHFEMILIMVWMDSSPKNYVINYSPSCRFKPARHSSFLSLNWHSTQL